MENHTEVQFSGYSIKFNSLFKIPEVGNSFYQFLQKEFSHENWDFILSLQNLETLCQKKSTKKIIQLVNLIKNTFIAEKSPKELEVDKKQKEEILNQLSKMKNSWNLKISPQQLFEPIEKIILMEYKNDAFKRFIRTPECLKLIEKHKNNRHMLQPQLSQVFNYKNEDFKKQPPTKVDKEFLENLQKDNPNWLMVFEDKKTKTIAYLSQWEYFPSLTEISPTNFKMEFFFDAPLQAVAIACLMNYHKNDPFLTQLNVLEYKHNSHVLVDEHIKFFYFNELRVKRNYHAVDYDPEHQRITLTTKPCQIEDYPFIKSQEINLIPKKGEKEKGIKCVQFFTYFTIVISSVGENKTWVQFVSCADLGGKVDGNAVVIKLVQGFQHKIGNGLKAIGKNAKISEFKYALNELWEGLPVDPIGKLLMDLDIDSIDKVYQEKMEKRKEVFISSNFVIHFKSLKRKEISEAYLKFLKLKNNSDSWELVSEISQLRNLNEKRYFEKENEKLKHILSTYIDDKSPKDLSINKDLKDELKRNLQLGIKEFPTFKYFDKIVQKIKLEHQLDSFQQFISSDMAKDILAKYQHDVEVMTPILSVQSTYKDDDFTIKSFNLADYQFVNSILKNSSTWDLVLSNKTVKMSESKTNWFPDVKFIDGSVYSFHYEYIFDSPLEKVANGYFTLSKQNTIDSNITKSRLVEYYSINETAVLENEMIWEWGKPLTKKNVCCFIPHGKSITFVGKPLVEDSNDKSKYFQYEIVNIKESGGKTKFKQIICIYSKEMIDWRKAAMERGKTFYFSLADSVAKSPKTIQDCEELYSQKDSKDLPKDVLGRMLLNLQMIENEFSFNLTETSDGSTTESEFDDELTSTEIDIDDEEEE
jgi:hypothetical protein